MIDFVSLRALLPAYCERQGIYLRQSGPDTLQGRCPIHREKNGTSFVVFLSDFRFRCFGKCDRGGDIVDLDLALNGGELAGAVARIAAMQLAAEINGSQGSLAHNDPPRLITPDNPLGLPYALSVQEREICAKCAHRLARSAYWQREFADRWGWKEQTVRELALEGSLGVDGGSRICYLYDSGLKTRYTDLDNGERIIRWKFGKPSLWRSAFIKTARKVFLTEGETDAISLIDEGVEGDNRVIVVATPCAGFNVAPYASLFEDKEVVLVPDPDKAGIQAGTKWAHTLEPHAAKLSYLSYLRKEPCR